MKDGVEIIKGSYPKINIYDRDGKFCLDIFVPELSKEKIMLEVTDGNLTIKGGSNQDKDVSESNFYLREVSRRAFSRTLKLPDGLNVDSTEANLSNGMLRVSIPFIVQRKSGIVKRVDIGG